MSFGQPLIWPVSQFRAIVPTAHFASELALAHYGEVRLVPEQGSGTFRLSWRGPPPGANMPDDVPTPSERMSAAFSRLRTSASQIKALSNELDQHVDALERALAKLDLRVACWTRLSEWMGPDNDTFKRTYVGYSEHKRRWRIVVQTSEGRDSFPDESDDTTWTFEEAPQYLRVKAVDKLPELVEDLVASVDKTAERMKKKVGPAAEIAKAVQTLTIRQVVQKAKAKS